NRFTPSIFPAYPIPVRAKRTPLSTAASDRTLFLRRAPPDARSFPRLPPGAVCNPAFHATLMDRRDQGNDEHTDCHPAHASFPVLWRRPAGGGRRLPLYAR